MFYLPLYPLWTPPGGTLRRSSLLCFLQTKESSSFPRFLPNLKKHHFLDADSPIWNIQNKANLALLFFVPIMAKIQKGPFPGSSFPTSYGRSMTSRGARLSARGATHLPQDFTTIPRAGLQEDGSFGKQKLPQTTTTTTTTTTTELSLIHI